MSDRIINEDVLEKVSGGAGDANEDAKKKEFEEYLSRKKEN